MGGSKAGIVRERIWSRLRDVALPDSRFHLELRRGDPGLPGQRGRDRPAGRAALLRERQLRLHHPGQLPGRPAPAHARCRQEHGGLDLRHLSRLRAAGAGHGAQGPGAVRGLARRARAFRPADHAGRDRRPRRASTSWSPAPPPSRARACASARDTASSISNGACSPRSASSTRPRRSRRWSTTSRWSRSGSSRSPTDITVDWIATPGALHRVERGPRPHGVHWELLSPEQIAATPPLQELQRIRGREPPASEDRRREISHQPPAHAGPPGRGRGRRPARPRTSRHTLHLPGLVGQRRRVHGLLHRPSTRAGTRPRGWSSPTCRAAPTSSRRAPCSRSGRTSR